MGRGSVSDSVSGRADMGLGTLGEWDAEGQSRDRGLHATLYMTQGGTAGGE